MQKRFCDRCQALMPITGPETVTFTLTEGGDAIGIQKPPSPPRQWSVTVTAPRDRDLCIPCRKCIVSTGKP